MKCLETRKFKTRPGGYGMIGRPAYRIVSNHKQPTPPWITPFPTGRIVSADFPGISAWTSASSVESLPSFRPSGTPALQKNQLDESVK
jgi:hypothetical protein